MDSMDQIDTQAFFTDDENCQEYIRASLKRRKYSDGEDQSQSMLAPKHRITDKTCDPGKTTPIENEDDKISNNEESKSDSSDHCSAKTKDAKSDDRQCVLCTFDKDLDKRNYYFGNLLIGELQFLTPCMRSEAYINILKYVDSLKHQHRK